MISLLQQDSLAITSLATVAKKPYTFNIWLCIAVIEAILIIALLFVIYYRKSAFHKRKYEILAEQPDFGNLFNSAFNANSLYKELLKKCHPDRFAPDTKKMAIAEELCLRITKNRNNIKALQELSIEVNKRLL